MIPERAAKPLGRKAYGSIGHLPFSRMGPGDHAVPDGMARICTEKPRDRHDHIYVQEKLDGSCCAVALFGGQLHALGRAGYPAISSPYEQHKMFHDWVMLHADRFFAVLREGERIVGEWLAQAHGTRYDLSEREPFVPFDIMTGETRLTYGEFSRRLSDAFHLPPLLCEGVCSVERAMAIAGEQGDFGATEPIEGFVWRVERAARLISWPSTSAATKSTASTSPTSAAGRRCGIFD
jgi:hypothetical protein